MERPVFSGTLVRFILIQQYQALQKITGKQQAQKNRIKSKNGNLQNKIAKSSDMIIFLKWMSIVKRRRLAF